MKIFYLIILILPIFLKATVVTKAQQRYLMLNGIRFESLDKNQYLVLKKNNFYKKSNYQLSLCFSKSSIDLSPIDQKLIPEDLKIDTDELVFKMSISEIDSTKVYITFQDYKTRIIIINISTLIDYQIKLKEAKIKGIELSIPEEEMSEYDKVVNDLENAIPERENNGDKK